MSAADLRCVVCSLCLCEVGGGDTELGWSWDSTKLDKIGGNWHKLGLMRPGAAAVPGLGGGSGLQCALDTSIPDIMAREVRLLAPAGAPGLLSQLATTGHQAMDKLTEPTAAGNRVTRPQPRPAVPPPAANQRPGRGRAAAG